VIEAFWRTLICDSSTSNSSYPADNGIGHSFRCWLIIEIAACIQLAKDRGLDSKHQLWNLANLKRLESLDSTGFLPTLAQIEAFCKTVGSIADEGFSFNQSDIGAMHIRKILDGSGSFNREISKAAVGRGLFSTERGYIGLGLQSMKAGDEIWILPGCPTPLTLRMAEQPLSSRVVYKIVEECYVHSIIHGEAIDKSIN
jgi:hypothetical protein